eukprot:295915-Chlamydomonas_euryale.AAC.1
MLDADALHRRCTCAVSVQMPSVHDDMLYMCTTHVVYCTRGHIGVHAARAHRASWCMLVHAVHVARTVHVGAVVA